EVYETTLDAGHFGLVVGSQSTDVTWPTVVDWLHWIDRDRHRDDAAPRPARIEPLSPHAAIATRPTSDLERGVNLAANITAGLGRAVVTSGKAGVRAMRDVAVDAVSSLSRLN